MNGNVRKSSPDNPATHIVSFRVSDEEYRELSRWRRSSGMSLSGMLRTVFNQMENPFKGGMASNENN
jgi:hypothetical protein